MNELNNKIDGLIDKYREDIMLAAQGINSDSEKYKETSINVAALASINLKSDLEALITEQVRLGRIAESKLWYDEWGNGEEQIGDGSWEDFYEHRLAQLKDTTKEDK